MRKGLWKQFIAGLLVATMVAGTFGTNLSMVKAADVETEVIELGDTFSFDQESQDIMDEYQIATAEDEEGFFEALAIEAMKHIASKAFDKIEDKAYDKIFDMVFGSSDKSGEILEKLGVLEGKIDRITDMLNDIASFLKMQEYENSIGKLLGEYHTIKAMADEAKGDIAASRQGNVPDDVVEARRWDALQSWYKLQLEGCGNSMASFRRTCNRLTNTENLNGKLGNFIQQYEKLGKYGFDWDSQRVAFTQAQKDRDFYYVIETATLNLLYIQYAEKFGDKNINYNAKRQQIQELLNSVIAAYEKTPVVKLQKDSVHYAKVTVVNLTDESKEKVLEFTLSKAKGSLKKDFIKNQIVNEIRDERDIREVRDNFKHEVDKSKPEGYHMMTNGEREELLKYAGGGTLWDYLTTGGMDMKSNGDHHFLTTSLERDNSYFYSYGDSHTYSRNIYLEGYDMTQKEGHRNTLLANASVRGLNTYEFKSIGRNASEYNNCLFAGKDDHIKDFINYDFAYIWVKNDSSKMEEPELQENEYIENGQSKAEGIIETIIQAEKEGEFNLSLQTDDGLIQVICDKDSVVEGELVEGNTVSIVYHENEETKWADSITVKQIDDEQNRQTEAEMQKGEVEEQ